MKSRLFHIVIFLVAVLLVLFTISSDPRSNAIMANVESQKTAISFEEPVLIRAIHITEGQHVKKGDLLIEVERPDLILDRTKIQNERAREQAKRKRLMADYQSKLRLLDIEIQGKIQRLASEVEQIQAEMRYNEKVLSNIASLAGSDTTAKESSAREEDLLQIRSLEKEMEQLQAYSQSEKVRHKILLEEDLASVDLQLELLKKEEEALAKEEQELKRTAPFDGTIGNVNAQLMELIPPFETIISMFEQRPSTITAHLNLESEIQVSVGQKVQVESFSREYSAVGEVLEIGSRIVGYRDQSLPPSSPEMFGREIFIKLPPDNEFLYGEQVFVFPPTD